MGEESESSQRVGLGASLGVDDDGTCPQAEF